MEDHSMKFRLDGGSDLFCIIPDAVSTDVDLSGYFIRLGQIECDDVGVVIVLKKVSVDFKKPRIRAEDVIDRVDFLPLLFK